MAAETEPRNGISHSWDLGEPVANVRSQLNSNFLKIGSLIGLSIITRYENDPPVGPVDGDAYIIGAVPTGQWDTDGRVQHDIAIYNTDLPSPFWQYYRPSDFRARLIAFLEEVGNQRIIVWNGTNWDLQTAVL